MAGLRARKVSSMVAMASSSGIMIHSDHASARGPRAARSFPTKSAVGRGPGPSRSRSVAAKPPSSVVSQGSTMMYPASPLRNSPCHGCLMSLPSVPMAPLRLWVRFLAAVFGL